MIKAQLRSDKVAASLSMVCVIHCFFAPSLLIFSYSFLSFSLESELVHYLILGTAVPISLLALFLGFKNHQTYSFFYIGVVGLALMTLDVILVESGDYCKVVNDSDHDQLTYLRVFDRGGWRQ